MLSALDPTTRTVLVLAVLAGLYLLSGLVWPYATCPSCNGGRHHSPTGKNWRNCGKCGGSGKKTRLVSRLLGHS